MKKILVCGDLVWDTHIARLPSDPRGYFQPHSQSQLGTRYGGAWYLCDMIKLAIQAAQPEINGGAEVVAPERVARKDIEENEKNSAGIAKAFSVWEWFAGSVEPAKTEVGKGGLKIKWKRAEAFPGTWRIKEFLGCQTARWPEKEKPTITCPPITLSGDPDLLVVDDLGLGFAEQSDCWPNSLKEGACPVLIKATPRFDRPLWRKLLNNPSRVTVIVTGSALRDAGVHISRGLSWDQTIQDIQDEFAGSEVCRPLQDCQCVIVCFGNSGAAVFSRSPRSPEELTEPPKKLRFERFVFDPAHLEESWTMQLAGTTFGASSVITASVAVRYLTDPPASSHISVSRGLAAARALQRVGGGHDETTFTLTAHEDRIFGVDSEGLPRKKHSEETDEKKRMAEEKTIAQIYKETSPERKFRSAFPRELLDEPVLTPAEDLPKLRDQTLLTDVLGFSPDFLTVAAEDIVRFGKNRRLQSVPRLELGDYFTVDREEIERLNAVRNLIVDYSRNSADRRPLSLAVFGPPGSGKSFAIKELSESLFGKENAVEFNLSQLEDLAALHQAFHQVRDKSLQGKVPFVFWDEFDSTRNGTKLGWLKEFLAPMQDAKFVANGISHPFGKCIFIFAGGTKATFKEFIRPIDREAWLKGLDESREGSRRIQNNQRPRLRQSLEGLRQHQRAQPYRKKGHRLYHPSGADAAFFHRKAPQKPHSSSQETTGYQPDSVGCVPSRGRRRTRTGLPPRGSIHGGHCQPEPAGSSRHFGPSELPGRELVDLHASPDFLRKVEDKTQHHLSPEDLEELSAKKHGVWRKEKEAQGFKEGPRNDAAKLNPMLVDYTELVEADKERNRLPARLAPPRLFAMGYRLAFKGLENPRSEIDPNTILTLARSEHRRWMREMLIKGFEWGVDSKDELFLHRDICRFARLDDTDSRLDHQIIEAIQAFVEEKGLVVVRKRSVRYTR